MLQNTQCPTCDSAHTEPFETLQAVVFQHIAESQQTEQIWFCRDCTLLFRPHAVSAAHLDVNYTEAFADIDSLEGWRRLGAYLYWNALEKDWISREADRRIPGPTKDFRVLEVGAKSGGFGHMYATEGYSVEMLEPTKTWAAFTQSTLGIPSKAAFYTAEEYDRDAFDLILAGGVVHRVQPMTDFFIAAAKHLRPGGLLYCREPNALNMSNAFLQDLHRAYFTPYSFLRFAHRYGFHAVAVRDWSDDARVPFGWNTSFSALLVKGPGPLMETAKPTVADLRQSITATVLGVGENLPLYRKTGKARAALLARKLLGWRGAALLYAKPTRAAERVTRLLRR
ncbi:MAG: methyltransferase domain-containing protein [Rhodospirillales bacterium]|nr:methyltransferase domain-containing protein [Rhodospirillales bacterium]